MLTEATAFDGYMVHVGFADGSTADVDLSHLLGYGGVFEPLHDPAYFALLRADAEAGTIVWPNDADIAPETLYAHARRKIVGRCLLYDADTDVPERSGFAGRVAPAARAPGHLSQTGLIYVTQWPRTATGATSSPTSACAWIL